MQTRGFLRIVVLAVVPLLLQAGCAPPPPPHSTSAAVWASPNLLVDKARLEAIRRAVTANEPVLTAAYADLVRTADRLVTESPKPIVGELKVPGFYTRERETQQRIARQLRHDARTAHALALAYALTDREDYAAQSKAFVFAWVHNLTKPTDGGSWWVPWERRGDTPLVIAYGFPPFIYAFDLLKGSGRLTPDEVAAFRKWLQTFADYCMDEEFYKNNHHNWQVVFLMCAAHALEDPPLFERAVRYYRNGIRSQIRADGGLPRELRRREKAGTYTLMAIEAMTQAVHLAEQHGYTDVRALRSRTGGNLECAVDFYIEYLRDPKAWSRHTNAASLNAPENRADWGYVFELPNGWWRKEAYQPYVRKRPYGLEVPRCYTLDFATLCFYRPD